MMYHYTNKPLNTIMMYHYTNKPFANSKRIIDSVFFKRTEHHSEKTETIK